MATADALYLVRLYGAYDAGHLLNSGGIVDQPAFYLDAVRLIGSILNAKKRH